MNAADIATRGGLPEGFSVELVHHTNYAQQCRDTYVKVKHGKTTKMQQVPRVPFIHPAQFERDFADAVVKTIRQLRDDILEETLPWASSSRSPT